MTKKQPVVSVLMTSYNREKYIAEAIESVLASTFEDFELIIVDDGSKDKTLEIARQYETDARVRIHLNEKNLGDYPNRNRAAELACGQYLKYVDSDDVIYPHGLEVMVRSMEQFPEAGFGLCSPQDIQSPYPCLLSGEQAYHMHFFELGIFNRSPLSAIMRKNAFEKVGGFSPSEGPRGDFEMWLRMAAQYSVVLLPAGLGWWRAHESQETRYRLLTMIEDVSRQHRLVVGAIENPGCPLDRGKREHALGKTRRDLSRKILRLAASSPRAAHAIRCQSGMSLNDLFKAFAKY